MIIVFILFQVFLTINASELHTVTIPNGKIQGSIDTSYNGRTFVQFEGIPYAQPPIGDLRFEDPQKVNDWHGTWVANFTTSCLQIAHVNDPEGGTAFGEEDCLHLNIYVPYDKITSGEKLDVIVHIHGGAFMFGKSTYYALPKYLMDRDVILVTMNYRVGIFGFLSTEDEHLSGNLGLKDQSFALKWIKDNIENFGGNSESITITGLSAGGASVHLHYFSPLSKGLFKQGISTSGCALNNWVVVEDALKKTQTIAKEVGCYDESTSIMAKCLKSRSGTQLNEAIKKLRIWLFNPYSPIGVVVDRWSKNPFLPEHPYKALKEGKVLDVPWIVSSSTSEGLYPGADFVLNNYFADLEKHWLEYAPAIMHYMDSVPENMKNQVSQKVKQHYLGNKPINKETYLPLIQMIGDRLFVADIEKSARLQASVNRSPVYYYQFDYIGEKVPSVVYLVTQNKKKYGVCHGDDMLFVFSYIGDAKSLPRMTENDERIKEFLIDFWISYAKTGKPGVPDWKPISRNLKDDFRYLYINLENSIKSTKELGHRSFWDGLPFAENHNLFTEYQRDEL